MVTTNARADLSAELARARAIGVDLGTATDELNKAITEAEQALTRMRLGVSGSVQIDKEQDEEGIESWRCLTFGKHGGTWRLFVEYATNRHNEVQEEPLVNASKEVRLLAVKRLADLVKELAVTASSQIGEVRAATAEVHTIVAAIKEGEPNDFDPF